MGGKFSTTKADLTTPMGSCGLQGCSSSCCDAVENNDEFVAKDPLQIALRSHHRPKLELLNSMINERLESLYHDKKYEGLHINFEQDADSISIHFIINGLVENSIKPAKMEPVADSKQDDGLAKGSLEGH